MFKIAVGKKQCWNMIEELIKKAEDDNDAMIWFSEPVKFIEFGHLYNQKNLMLFVDNEQVGKVQSFEVSDDEWLNITEEAKKLIKVETNW